MTPIIRAAATEQRALVWHHLDPAFSPEENECTYICVWQAFETFYDAHAKTLVQEEDRVNACVKWLHDLKTKVEKVEATGDHSPEYRDRLVQLKQRVDEITEFVMHKFRCFKFGV